AEGFGEVLPLGQGKNAGGKRDSIADHDYTPIVNGVVREKNSFQHLGRGLAIDDYPGLDHLLKLDGLLNGDDCSDADFSHSFDRLNDDLNVLALFPDSVEQRKIAKLGKHTP